MRIDSDIDIDFGDRDKLLSIIKHTPASMRNITPMRRHNTGVYITDIPYDPINNMSALHYEDAEKRGYFKLDFLNVHVYSQVRDEKHLIELMCEPEWSKLNDRVFVEKLIHLANHYQIQFQNQFQIHHHHHHSHQNLNFGYPLDLEQKFPVNHTVNKVKHKKLILT